MTMVGGTTHMKETEWIDVDPIIAGRHYVGYIGARTVITDDGETWSELDYYGTIFRRITHDRRTEHRWRTIGSYESGYSEHLKVCVLFCDHCRSAKADARWDFI